MDKTWPKWLIILAFIGSTILGGNNAIAVRFSNAELPPFFGAVLRFSAASLILFVSVLALGLPIPKGRALMGTIIFGALQYGISYALIYWSLLEVPAGMFQVVLALVPLLTFLFAILHHQEVFQWRVLAGGILSLAGIAIVFRDGINANLPWLSLFAVVLVAACFAESMILFKSFPKSHPITTNAIAMGVGAVILMGFSLISGESLRLPSLPSTWIAVSYLALFGSVVVFVLHFFVLKHWPASASAYGLVLSPIVTVLFASWLADEPIYASLIIGGFLVLLGVYVGALAPVGLLNKFFSGGRGNSKLTQGN